MLGQYLRAFIMAGREEEGLRTLRALLERSGPGPHKDTGWLRVDPTGFPAAIYLLDPARLSWLREQQAEVRKEDVEKEARDAAVAQTIDFEDHDEEEDGDEERTDAEDDEVSEVENLDALLLEVPQTLSEGMAEVFQDAMLSRETATELTALLDDLKQVDVAQLARDLADPDEDELNVEMWLRQRRMRLSENTAQLQAVDALSRRDVAAFREGLALAPTEFDWTDWLGYPPIEWLALAKKARELHMALLLDDFVGWDRPLASFALSGR